MYGYYLGFVMYVWFDLFFLINIYGIIKYFYFYGIFVNYIRIGSVYDIKWFSLNYIKKKVKFLSIK